MLKCNSLNFHSNTRQLLALQICRLSEVRTGWLNIDFDFFNVCVKAHYTFHTTLAQIVLIKKFRHNGILFMRTFYNVVNSIICCPKEARASIALNTE